MATKRRGLTNTKNSPRLEESSNISGGVATAKIMMEMKKMFNEKLQALEKDNKVLKEKAGRSEQSNSERNSVNQSKRTKEESKVKIVKNSTKSLESLAASSSKTVNSNKRAIRHVEINESKRKEKEKEKATNMMELND